MARTDILDTLTDIKIQNFAHFKLHKSLVALIKGPFTWRKEDPSTKKIREGEKTFCLFACRNFGRSCYQVEKEKRITVGL